LRGSFEFENAPSSFKYPSSPKKKEKRKKREGRESPWHLMT
jgi:hypothetical protein